MKQTIITILILWLATNAYAQTIPNYIPQNGLIAWYPFNGNANDESGNGNNGVIYGATIATDRFGNASSAYGFNGFSDYINIVNSILPTTQTSFTISLWFNSSDTDANFICDRSGASNLSKYAIGTTSGYGYKVRSSGNPSCNYHLFANTNFNPSIWNHVVVTKDVIAQVTNLYLNGVLVGTDNHACYTNFSSPTAIGRGNSYYAPYGDTYTNGLLDDIGIWNKVLTNTEIQHLYTYNPIPAYLPQSGLIAWYPFNGNANDESGNGNNGTNVGATLTTDRLGNANKAYSFNGSNNRIDLPLNLNGTLPNLRKFSLQCYVKDLSVNGGGIFSNWKGSPLTDPFGILVGTGTTSFSATNNTGTGVSVNSVSLSNWSHLAVVFDGDQTGALNRMKLYINGVLQQTDSGVLSSSNVVISDNLGSTATNTAIGAWMSQFGWRGYFNGVIDDVAIWNRTLSQAEITALYANTNCATTTSTTNLTIPSTNLPYSWNGLTFNASGSQTAHLTNSCGSDSAATLNLTATNTIPNSVPTNGLLAWYPFNGNANDESGNGNNGTVTNATLASDKNGLSNKAYYFNGSSKIISTISTLPTSNNPRTISTWFQWDSVQAVWDHRIVNYGSCPAFTHGGSFGLGIWDTSGNGNSTNAVMYLYGCGNGDVKPAIHPNKSWHNMVGTYDGTVEKLYIDGIFVKSLTYNLNTVLSQLVIGMNEDQISTNGNFKGKIDDIAIWNRALTQQEITVLNTGITCTPTTSTTNTSICPSQLPYTWNGKTLTGAGTLIDTLTNAGGCDSIATLNLTVKATSTSTTNISICPNALPYSWNGLTYSAAGSQTKHLTNSAGCDSAATLNLTVTAQPTPAANTVCVGSTIQLTNATSSGVWASTNNRANVNATGLVTGTNAGGAVITYKKNGVTTTYNIAVNAIPNVPSIVYASGAINPQLGAPTGAFCINKTFGVVGIPAGGVFTTGNNAIITINCSGIVNTVGLGYSSLNYRYTNAQGCSNSRTMVGTVVNCAARSSITNNKLETANEFSLYPNPARNTVTINSVYVVAGGQIVVSNLMGKQVKLQSLSLGNNVIDITNLSKGFYLVSVITNECKQTQKLIIE